MSDQLKLPFEDEFKRWRKIQRAAQKFALVIEKQCMPGQSRDEALGFVRRAVRCACDAPAFPTLAAAAEKVLKEQAEERNTQPYDEKKDLIIAAHLTDDYNEIGFVAPRVCVDGDLDPYDVDEAYSEALDTEEHIAVSTPKNKAKSGKKATKKTAKKPQPIQDDEIPW